MLQFLSGEQAHGVGEARSGSSTFDFDPPGCAGVAVVCERFSLVNEVSARRVEMERLRMLLRRGGGTFSLSSAPSWFVITKSHCEERRDSWAEWLAGQPPLDQGPTAEFGFDVSQASRKETQCFQGWRLCVNQSITREGAPQTSMVPYRIPTVRSSTSKVVSEVPSKDTVPHVPCWPGHEAGHINQKKIKPIV